MSEIAFDALFGNFSLEQASDFWARSKTPPQLAPLLNAEFLTCQKPFGFQTIG